LPVAGEYSVSTPQAPFYPGWFQVPSATLG
jgi:hypothetical protein